MGTSPPPLPQASVPSPRTKGWGDAHSSTNSGSAGLRSRLGLRVPYPKFLFEYSLGAPPLLQYKFLVPDWGDKIDYVIGLSYRYASLCSLAGWYDNLTPKSSLSPPSKGLRIGPQLIFRVLPCLITTSMLILFLGYFLLVPRALHIEKK
jgi:hypothetical protein